MSTSRSFPTISFLLIMLLLCGCSPALYKQPIRDFSATVTDSGQLLNDYLEANRVAVLAVTVENIASERKRLSYTREDGSVKVIDTDYSLDPNPAPNAKELIVRITRYANSLRSIVESNTREELEGGIERLAISINSLPGRDNSASLDQIAGTLKNVSGFLLDKKKNEIIKAAVLQADDDIRKSGEQLKRIIGKAKDNVVLNQRMNLDRLIRQYNEVKTSGVNNELLLKKISADMRDLKKQTAYDPSNVIDQMLASHQALKDIAENKISEADLLREISRFQQTLIEARY